MWASLVPLVRNSVWGYTVFSLYIRHFVWGYTVFPLNNKGKFCVGVHSFLPLYKGCSSCVSNNPGTVFSLNIRNSSLNSVIFYQTAHFHLETPGVLVPIRDTDTHPWCLSCPKLTRDHLWLTSYSKMKVKLAAQVCESYR